MAYNPAQFNAKKKRAVDPNTPPRPNLLTHEKKMKESQLAFDELYHRVRQQEELIASLKAKMNVLEITVNWVMNKLRGAK